MAHSKYRVTIKWHRPDAPPSLHEQNIFIVEANNDKAAIDLAQQEMFEEQPRFFNAEEVTYYTEPLN